MVVTFDLCRQFEPNFNHKHLNIWFNQKKILVNQKKFCVREIRDGKFIIRNGDYENFFKISKQKQRHNVWCGDPIVTKFLLQILTNMFNMWQKFELLKKIFDCWNMCVILGINHQIFTENQRRIAVSSKKKFFLINFS